MTREDIIKLAREAGFEQLGPDIEDWVCFTEEIERFAALVAAAERQACAKECDELAGMFFCYGDKSGAEIAVSLRDTIRARGQQ